MSFLKNSTKGKIKKPYMIIVYGPPGVGKSTFASQAPSPIFLGAENGTYNIDTTRGEAPKNWAAVMGALGELATETHPYKTLVVDSLDWLEPLVFEKVCAENGGVNTIEKVGGGFGKGVAEALTHWRTFASALEVLREKKGMHVILIAHAAQNKVFDTILQEQIERCQLKLAGKGANEFFREFVDAMLFANYETLATVDSKKGVRAISDGTRLLHTERSHGFDAKNRFGLPEKIDLAGGWAAFAAAVEAGNPDSLDAIRTRIAGLISQVTDQELLAAVGPYVEANRENAGKLLGAEAKLKEKLGLK